LLKARIDELRRIHLSYIMADQSSFSLYMDNTRPIPRPWTARRRASRYRYSTVGKVPLRYMIL
jgi:hypothetical protein